MFCRKNKNNSLKVTRSHLGDILTSSLLYNNIYQLTEVLHTWVPTFFLFIIRVFKNHTWTRILEIPEKNLPCKP